VTHSVQLPGGQGMPAAASRNLLSHWRAPALLPALTESSGDSRQSRQSAFGRAERSAAVASPQPAHKIKGTQFGGAALEQK